MKKALKIVLCISLALMVSISCTLVSFGSDSITEEDKDPEIVKDDTDAKKDDSDDRKDSDSRQGSGSGSVNNVSEAQNERVIEKADSGRYKDDRVKDIVKNGGTPSEIAEKLGADPTLDGISINLDLYDRITDFFDIGERTNGQITFKGGKDRKVTIQADAVKGLDRGDFLIMIINPDTGELYLVTPDEFDSATGTMKLTLPTYGAFSIIQKVPIVVRDVHTEDYTNRDVAFSVSKLDSEAYIELTDWLKAFGIEDDRLEVADGVTVDVEDYNSANVIADIAVQVNRQEFNYKLSTKVWGNLYQDINECDWGRVLDYAGIDYDAEKLKKTPTQLTEIEPFVLEDSFVYHVDADTGEVSIAYEPEISFKTEADYMNIKDKKVKNGLSDPEENIIDRNMDKTENSDNVEEVKNNIYRDDTSIKEKLISPVYAKAADNCTEEQKEILTFDVNDIDEKNTENLCMVMTSNQYIGMGPFMLFMPKEKFGFAWWWILIIIAVLIIAFVIYRSRKSRNKKASA